MPNFEKKWKICLQGKKLYFKPLHQHLAFKQLSRQSTGMYIQTIVYRQDTEAIISIKLGKHKQNFLITGSTE